MANPVTSNDAIAPLRIDDIVTEDDTPVDNIASEKQQRLLTEPLYSSWRPPDGRTFLAAANVGVFSSVNAPPLVPDVFLSLDVAIPQDWWPKRHRSYFIWEYGKPPEAIIEIVSNREGNETTTKLTGYARLGVTYYAIYDPLLQVQAEPLAVYSLQEGRYIPRGDFTLPAIGLGLALWSGSFEDTETTWLRWCDSEGRVIPTGKERAEEERRRAEEERRRAERLAARLRALGVDPDSE